MQEINVLRKNDLPYFERLEKEGKAVILRFSSMEEFASFDLASYLGDESEKPLTLDEVKAWLAGEKPAVSALKERIETITENIQKDQDLTEKYLRIGQEDLSDREKVVLVELLGHGITGEELDDIFDPLITVEDRSSKIKKTAKKYHDKTHKG